MFIGHAPVENPLTSVGFCSTLRALLRNFALAVLAFAPGPVVGGQEALELVAKYGPAESYPRHFGVRDGLILFDHYSGNGSEIVSFDLLKGDRSVLASNVASSMHPPLVAMNEQYLVVLGAQSFAPALKVIERTNGKVVAQKRLRDPIAGAVIAGDKLAILQGSQGLTFELKTLKLLTSTPIDVWARGSASTVLLPDRFLVSNIRSAILLNSSFKKLATLPLPTPKASPPYGPWLFFAAHSGNKLVMNASGDLLVFDVEQGVLLHTIPAFANFYTAAIAGGFLFVNPSETDNAAARVFDLNSGRGLLSFAFEGSFIGSKDDLVVATRQASGKYDPKDVFVYRVNKQLDTSSGPDWRGSAVINAHKAASEIIANDGDFYRALDVLENAGIHAAIEDALSGKPPPGEELIRAAEDYGRWLTKTLSRVDEGLSLLDRIAPITQAMYSQELVEGGYKHFAFKHVWFTFGSKPQTANDLEQREEEIRATWPDATRPSKVWARPGLARAASFATPIDFGSFPNLIKFQEDRVYVARWDCSPSSSGVTLDVLERKTLRPIKRIPILGCDEEQQDGIGRISFVGDLIALQIDYRYEDSSRTNLVVVNSRNLEVSRKGHVDEDLVFEQGEAASCDRVDEKPKAVRFDLETLSATRDPSSINANLACRASPNDPPEYRDAHMLGFPGGNAVAIGPRYILQGEPGSRRPTYRFWSLKDKSVVQGSVSDNNLTFVGFSADGEGALFVVRQREGQRLIYHSIPDNKSTAVLDLADTTSVVHAVARGKRMYLLFNRGLLVFDTRLMQPIYYEDEFIDKGFANNGHGVDLNRASEVLLDGDRALVLTFDGRESRTIDLPLLDQYIDSGRSGAQLADE